MGKPSRTSMSGWLILIGLCLATPAHAGPPRDLFGVKVGMTYEKAQKCLEKVGRKTSGSLQAGGAKEIWQLDDERFELAIVKFNDRHVADWMTVFAREDGEPVYYRDIGDLESARLIGRYFYTWTPKESKNQTPFMVRAAGADSERLRSLSIYKVGGSNTPTSDSAADHSKKDGR